MDKLSQEQRDMRHTELTLAERKKAWLEISPDLTEEQFDGMMAHQRARQAEVPQPGRQAPDFELDLLDPARRRTGDTVRLSALHGKPVALIFGSYT